MNSVLSAFLVEKALKADLVRPSKGRLGLDTLNILGKEDILKKI
jgi:hypothetical protein